VERVSPETSLSSLEARARQLAGEHNSRSTETRGRSAVRGHLRKLAAALEQVDRSLREEPELRGRAGAEWLLDNRHLVMEALLQVREDLTRDFVRDLPRLGSSGQLSDVRVMELARYLTRMDRSHVDLDRARSFLRAYQRECPLSMGELWAFPLLLRMALLEELARLGAGLAGVRPPASLAGGGEPVPEGGSVEDEVSGAIRSLRAVAREDWNRFFEATSRVEDLLRRGDPAGVYPRMDFSTRDRYRKAVEEAARACGRSEEDVARVALELASPPGSGGIHGAGHVGDLLVGPSRRRLEARLGCGVPWRTRWRRALEAAAFPLYLGAILLLAAGALALLYLLLLREGSVPQVALGLLLGLVPAVAVAVSLVNRTVPRLVPPRVLPKLALRTGIPVEWRTAVAVPCLLTDPDEVDALLGQLELNFLGNRDRNLSFVLLSDFADAPTRRVSGEDELLERARQGIRELNERHAGSGGAFLLLHRERRWNPAEGHWMGWERKRGKLVEFNGLLLEGDPSAFPVREGELDRLQGVRFVLSLDADTFLPQGAARRLVGTLAHPLNRPRFDEKGRVVKGYTVLQPRVEILPSEGPRTLFARVFEADLGLDLYSQAVSDVYQDLLGEGIFTGKGLYDVAAFERSLGDRVPENALLSHDLFEGVHGRAGLVSDVVVFEDFPDDLRTYLRRLHRWVRGDWQLLPWLSSRVPSRAGPRVENRIDRRGRWKILDNLRRSLLFPSLLALLLAGWFVLPGAPDAWTAAALLVLAVPALFGAGILFRVRAGVSRRWAPLADRRALPGSGALRWVLAVVFLPHQARIEADAIVRALYRLGVSRRHLLEWTTAAHAARQARGAAGGRRRWREMAEAPGLAVVVAGLFVLSGPVPISAVPLLLAWFLSPLVAHWVGIPREEAEARLTETENLIFRSVARRTWAYFEEFVGPEDHWLPPDHFQESPRGSAVHRTSPTNVGLTLVSALAAYDLGYLTLPRLVATLSNTLDGMDRLERHRGHLFNWYDTRDLTALEPRYVSTVDSGNLAASLLVVGRTCGELTGEQVLRPEEIQGLLDALRELETVLREIPPDEFPAEMRLLERLRQVEETLTAGDGDPRTRRLVRRSLMAEFLPGTEAALSRMVGAEGTSLDPSVLARLRGWIIRIGQQTAGVAQGVDELVPWLPILHEPPTEVAGDGAPTEAREAYADLALALPTRLSLSGIPGAIEEARPHLSRLSRLFPGNGAAFRWVRRMEDALEASEARAAALLAEISLLERRALEWVDGMSFRFLYDQRRRLFHIGYDASSETLDDSYYDLLASEARIASFLASAKGEIPARHWLHLGRPFGRAGGSAILLSWTGTLFEYLMPPIFLRTPPGSLLGLACRSAVKRQRAFASRHRIPWGISESAYNHLDSRATYQYRAFGVPELAIRRDVGDRLVVAPYASMLALPFQPRAVRENLHELIRLGMLGPYGLYDAIDFGRTGRANGQAPGIVRSFMAHHQGMILAAVANHLNGNRMVERFHRDSRIAAATYLLYERVPGHVRLEPPLPHSPDRPDTPGRPRALESWSPSPDRSRPAAHVLSNGTFSVLLTARGGGGIRWGERAVTRWRADPSLDAWGSWIYVRDLERGFLWSATQEPVPAPAEEEAVLFAPHRVEYRRRVQGISSRTKVTVPPEGSVEIRRVTLVNGTARTRRLRLASYGEVALADPSEDRRHPAFQKLFVESGYLAEAGALHFRRRRAAPEEAAIHVVHALGELTGKVLLVGWETDRERFLGRGGSPASPRILGSDPGRPDGAWGNDPGTSRDLRTTLDPIFSLILEVELPPGGKAAITFLTAAADSRDEAMEQVDRFRSPESVLWTEERARTRWERVLHELELPPERVRVAQVLLSHVLRPHHPLRADEAGGGESRRIHRRDALWGLGVSGDDPVVLLRISDVSQEERLEEMLRFHALWRRMGVRTDLLILDETAEGYHHPVRDRLVAALSVLGTDDLLHRPGGVHHVPASRLDPVHRSAVESVARVRLDAARGAVWQQLRPLERDPIRLPPFVPVPGRLGARPATAKLARPSDLLLDNGLGGFTPDGREYVIHLEEGEVTPAPWINVVATPEMGFTVSERGSGFTWAGNSAEHRLTTWSNDPVLDGPGEALYLRDEETARVWSPTPGPAPGPGAYQVRHGAGYSRFHHRSQGLDQRVELFAALEPSAKVVELRIRNLEKRPRRITATYYAEWVLGGSREAEAPHVVTRFHPFGGLLLAENRFAPSNGPPVAFLAADRILHGWTTDREEFLGRSGTADPAGLRRIGLGQVAGARLDPCGAVQVHLNLESEEEATVRFFLGAAEDDDAALARVRVLREPGAAERARETVGTFWEGLLSRTRVSTPDPSMDLLLNRWARYQALSCRIWGRSALYQSAGAFGFRDQLQDVLAFLLDAPGIARDHILGAARQQFVEGDVLHWWHPPESRGVRTRCSDDLLWLPFAVASYVRATGDVEILDERLPFLEGPALGPGEQEHYATFGPSREVASLHEHCLRALRRGLTRGPNGLPLIGLSDWNDGMDRLGRKGRGESVWLAWFSVATAEAYAELSDRKGDREAADELRDRAEALRAAAEDFAWDGAWYLRATHDDGSVVGSAEDPECRIDSIPQSWAVLSGGAYPERARTAMSSVRRELLDHETGVVLLLSPPFDRDPRWPGYIRAYPPGVRENGGQYTHAGTWVGWALAATGEGEEAMRVFRYLSPLSRTTTREGALRYRLEPYAVAGDIAGPPTHGGRGGWSWFTGSAAWLHRLGIEGILGFRIEGGGVRVDPCIPPGWDAFEVSHRTGGSLYRFRVENPDRVSRGVVEVELDGEPVAGFFVPLVDDGAEHDVRVRMGPVSRNPDPGSRILP
jgi:cyclic beta-1,2-glucan synthetase